MSGKRKNVHVWKRTKAMPRALPSFQVQNMSDAIANHYLQGIPAESVVFLFPDGSIAPKGTTLGKLRKAWEKKLKEE